MLGMRPGCLQQAGILTYKLVYVASRFYGGGERTASRTVAQRRSGRPGGGGASKVNRLVCRRLPSPSRKGRGRNLCLCLCLDLLAEPVDRGLRAALAVRDVQRGQGHFDDAEGAEDHWRIDVPHMSDAEGLAG
jgi:hypothetical protein